MEDKDIEIVNEQLPIIDKIEFEENEFPDEMNNKRNGKANE